MTESDDVRASERSRGAAWLAEKWIGSKNCPICSSDAWTVTEVSLLRIAGGDGREYFPVFHALCTVCGFTHSFSAVLAGVTAPPVDPESGEVG